MDVVFNTNIALIERGGHFVGSRPWRGGHTLIAYRGWEEKAFPIRIFCMNDGDSYHQAIVLEASDDDDVAALRGAGIVPEPFDHFGVNGDKLPLRDDA